MKQNCTYTLKTSKGNVEFKSLTELDYSLGVYMGDKINDYESNILYSIKQINDTEAKLNKIQEFIESKSVIKKYITTGLEDSNMEIEQEPYYIIGNSIGVTKFITVANVDGNLLTRKFDESDYFNNQGYSENQQKLLKSNWQKQTEVGTVIHKIAECIVKGEKLDLTDDQILMFGDNLKSGSEAINNIKEDIKSLIEDVKSKHGEDCKIFSEYKIISKDINDEYRVNIDGIKIDSINGVIDLLVIDQYGSAHIYDFKVSKKNVGIWGDTNNKNISLHNWWHSTKKLDIEYQLEFYRTALEQYGIHVSSVNIIPIKINFDETGINDDIQILGKVDDVNISYSKIISDNRDIKRQSFNVSKILPIQRITDGIDGLKSIHEPMSIMFPNFDVASIVKKTTANIDYFKKRNVRTISENSEERSKGKYVFYNKFVKENRGRIYCATEAELDDKIREYLRRCNEESANEMLSLSDQIINIISGSQEFDSIHLTSRGNNANDYLSKILKKYIGNPENKWEYQANESLASSGIFVFTKNNICEIITLTDQNISHVVNLGKGYNILGSKKHDDEVDEHKVLQATNGNLNLMKVMCLLNSELDKFSEYKINSIQCYNPSENRGVEESPEVLFEQFNNVCLLHNIENKLNKKQFSSILENVSTRVEDLIDDSQMKEYAGELLYDLDTIEDSTTKLKAMAEILMKKSVVRNELKKERPNFDMPELEALKIIYDAYLRITNHRVYIEPDPAKTLKTSGRIHVGIDWTSPELSPSLNIQSVGNIVSQAQSIINQENMKYLPIFSKAVKALYDSKDRNALVGGEVKYFDNLFETDDSGNKVKEFILKRPEDKSLSKEESEFIKVFLEIVNELKYNGDKFAIDEAKISGKYYECPLSKASFLSQRYNQGLVKSIKTEYDDVLNFLKTFSDQNEEYNNSILDNEVYNKYRIGNDTRQKILNNNEIDIFETHLEKLLVDYISAFNKEKVYNTIMPQIQGIKLVLQYNEAVFGQQIGNTLKYIDDYVKLNLFSKPIMDPELNRVYKMANAIKNITSATVLGLNVRSGMRELMQGMWNHLSRTMVQMYGKDQFKTKDVAQAWKIIFQLSAKNPNLITLLDLVNADYRMANADVEGVEELISQSKSGFLNFGSDSLYIFNRIPDSFHRLGLLIAKMLHDGSWEAHSSTDDGKLVYDFNKDKRFNLLNDKNANKNSNEYKSQLSLYLTMVEQFRKEGYKIPIFKLGEEIPALPRAYTLQEGNSIKSFADLCFGHYDKNTQMLAKHMFLGSFFLQFRTFLSAKLEQWILKPGIYNIGQYKEVFDINGDQIMRVITFDENGLPKVQLKKKSELVEGDNATPYKEWQGRFMEGIAYSMIDFGQALIKMDKEELNRLWKNDTKRANFYLFLTDMILMSIMMRIIYSLFLSDDSEELGPLGSITANALYTSFSDGPITELIASMGGDLNPPMYSQVKSMYNNTISMITGDKSVGQWLTGTFGAARDFKNAIA